MVLCIRWEVHGGEKARLELRRVSKLQIPAGACEVLDPGKGALIQDRLNGSGAGCVADGPDSSRQRRGQQTDAAGAAGIQGAAKGACQQDAGELLRGEGPVGEQQLDPGTEGSLGQLQRPDISLAQIDGLPASLRLGEEHKDEIKEYMRVVKKAAFSQNPVSKAESDAVARLYRLI